MMMYDIPGSKDTTTSNNIIMNGLNHGSSSPSPSRHSNMESPLQTRNRQAKTNEQVDKLPGHNNFWDSHADSSVDSQKVPIPSSKESPSPKGKLTLRLPRERQSPVEETKPSTITEGALRRGGRKRKSRQDLALQWKRRRSQRVSPKTLRDTNDDSNNNGDDGDDDKDNNSGRETTLTMVKKIGRPRGRRMKKQLKNASPSSSSPKSKSPSNSKSPSKKATSSPLKITSSTASTGGPNKIRIVLRQSLEASSTDSASQTSSPSLFPDHIDTENDEYEAGRRNSSPTKSRKRRMSKKTTRSPIQSHRQQASRKRVEESAMTTESPTRRRNTMIKDHRKLTSRWSTRKKDVLPTENINGDTSNLEENAKVVRRRKPRSATSTKTAKISNDSQDMLPIDEPEEGGVGEEISIINNEFCSACSGGGSLICCESCPRSFHFLCADPPVDPDNIPDDAWYCNECRARRELSPKQPKILSSLDSIWERILENVERSNPKAFCIPKRIRKLIQERESSSPPSKTTTVNNPNVSSSIKQIKLLAPGEKAQTQKLPLRVISTLEEEHNDEGGTNMILNRERLTLEGFCHYCNKRAREGANQQLICCDLCSLFWHLDCLPYPQTVYPSCNRSWYCPIHFTDDSLSVLNLSPEATVSLRRAADRTLVHIDSWPESFQEQPTQIVSENSIRFKLDFKVSSSGTHIRFPGCRVPIEVKNEYRKCRSLPIHELRKLQTYREGRYVDCSVEAEM